MVSGSRRAGINSTGLVRLLAELAVADVAPSKQSFAERLGQWLAWTDAISLSVALSGHAASVAESPTGATAAARAAAEQFVRVRTALSAAITSPVSGATDADYSPWRQHYVAQQRAMESAIGPLRAQVRSALAAPSPQSSRLAVLDAVLDDVLRAREGHLLSTVPALLEKHFDRLRKAQAGRAQAAFLKDMQAVLRAELELRLQPVEGLLEALRHHATRPR